MQWGDNLWAAMALVLVLEGLLPFVAPAAWRRLFAQLMMLRDGQIRFFALLCIAAGVLMLALS
ncbi:MAG: DUF2065 domain-containing protein [Acidovorax sp.]|nr:DUF2065 domain-containing protein [Acidovorax sp.]